MPDARSDGAHPADDAHPLVDGYPASPSVRAGGVLRLHLSTRADRFRADFFRCGAEVRHMGGTGGPGRYAPAGRYDQDWHWPGHDFTVPAHWPSGVYIAVLRPHASGPPDLPEPGAGAEHLDARHSRLLFVVTPAGPTKARVLYKVPVLTYHAYNQSGGGSLYGSLRTDDPPPGSDTPVTQAVTLRRPGGGIGGPVKGYPDAHDPRTPRQTFAHWDAPFVAWLERGGFTADYCTDLDLHQDPHRADGYRLLLSAGHDEYWSAPARRHVTAFRDRGGNLAVFGANTCWWRVTVSADGTTVRCAKHPPGAAPGVDVDRLRGAPGHWWESEPENTLTGVSYRNGGGHWEGPRAPLGFTVQHTGHELFAGTGLRDGDVLGAEHALVGYECDGAAHRRDGAGRAVATGADGTPPGFTILGVADLPADPAAGWHTAVREDGGPGRAATFGLYTSGGTVFTAATVDWPRLLALDPRVRTITHNVVTALS
ncbi:N,N-dimethylformamidase beta subunit family domain-containing protein [Kitasatospora sp. NPDC088548]|uniref:N,N-dimethylformamidase beta subunit family domain-containing protein n=1 Tax=Kitasatospora sp. NPDC088548 TaxID=3364075 RepID=UPI0037FA818F